MTDRITDERLAEICELYAGKPHMDQEKWKLAMELTAARTLSAIGKEPSAYLVQRITEDGAEFSQSLRFSSEEQTDTVRVTPLYSDPVGTWADGGKCWEPDPTPPVEPVDILARALCQIDGRQPDEIAPRQLVCGPYGEVLPNWEAYREKAEGILAGSGAPTVSSLEWAGDFAHTRLGIIYHLVGDDDGCVLERHELSSVIKSFWGSRKDARIGAQTDYEKRVLAALSTKKDA